MKLENEHNALVNSLIFTNLTKRLRGEDHSTIKELAEECEVSTSTISRKERDAVLGIYEEFVNRDPDVEEGEIAYNHNIRVNDIYNIMAYAERRNYV